MSHAGPPPDVGKFHHVHLIDTATASDNVGDEIIGDEARRHIDSLFPMAYLSSSAGHDGLGASSRQLVRSATLALLIGTNALSPRRQMGGTFIWHVAPQDVDLLAGKVVLFGVGANRDFDQVDPEQRDLLQKLLSRDHLHSVRDETGLKLLKAVGREGINTSCPTLWRYASAPPEVPQTSSDTVVFTLTAHKPDPIDARFIEILRARYKRLRFWPQQPRDMTYLESLGPTEGIEIIGPSLHAYDAALAETRCDVIGTRLHGCIRGLSHGRRILVIAIDNRARDIGAETGLPVVTRADVPRDLESRIDTGFATGLSVDPEPIQRFLSQFRSS
ncbi:polysaccharide pyruvyl transferase [Pseudoroseicyclus aestuarii]|uniref:Polysaccharide pyruvyl transferase n=1 Tax=Pseudoroseicyclus aestuarii TaxID=1795041 RepID=A0A318T4P2_9RHOB|nr:polysaccharide pyruvyl transferase [Pseudoroseicyclus aestuarii]